MQLPNDIVVVKQIVTSSSIKAATQLDVTSAARGGDFLVEDVLLQTDGTGLATGTNLQLSVTNAFGLAIFFSTAISGLGANKTIGMTTASVTKQPCVLGNGRKITVNCTGSDCTGTGKVAIFIKLRRLSVTAMIAPARPADNCNVAI